jgi:histidinol-phosphate aminotransferase
MFNPEHYIRADVEEMEAYTPILPFEVVSAQLGIPTEQIVKLDANENPYGPSPKVYAALSREPFYHIYPDPESRALRAKLSDYVGLDAEYILAGSGADELIDLIVRLFIEPGDRIINCPPTFGMYSFDVGVEGGGFVNVPRNTDFSIDVAQIEAVAQDPRTKVIFLTSPNNPDGSLLPDTDLERVLRLPLIVVLDEAYCEFSRMSRAQWVKDHANLIVLRTFSKWAGLAGLRIGYGMFPLAIIRHLWKIKQPYNVNVAANTAAIASLDDAGDLFQNVDRIIEERERLHQGLRGIAYLRPYPSCANFILCRVIGRDAQTLKQQLAQRGILVRYYNSAGLADHIRVSVGLPAHTDRLLDALAAI